MSEMIERVARAWCFENLGRNNECGHGCTKETGCLAKLDDDDLRNARAAIEAMREPTKAMADAGSAVDISSREASFAWQVMIDAALSEEPEDVA